jgi:hypothetical protein
MNASRLAIALAIAVLSAGATGCVGATDSDEGDQEEVIDTSEAPLTRVLDAGHQCQVYASRSYVNGAWRASTSATGWSAAGMTCQYVKVVLTTSYGTAVDYGYPTVVTTDPSVTGASVAMGGTLYGSQHCAKPLLGDWRCWSL